MLSFMKDYDVIVCPVNALPAMRHGDEYADELRPFSYTMTYNLTGWPGGVVRGGTSPEGLPIGVQIVAAPWREDIVLAVCSRMDSSRRRPPGQPGAPPCSSDLTQLTADNRTNAIPSTSTVRRRVWGSETWGPAHAAY